MCLGRSGGSWPAPQIGGTQYQDPTLDQLIELALALFADARHRARALRIGAPIGADRERRDRCAAAGERRCSRQRLSDNGLFPPQLLGFTWYNQVDLGLQASYTFDWWGKQRDAVEAAMDEAHASQADRSAAALMLASSVADTYFGWQADQSRLALARESDGIAVQREARDHRGAHRRGAGFRGTSRSRADCRAGRGARTDRDARRLGGAARRGAGGAGRPFPGELPPLTPKPLPPVAARAAR